MAIFLIILVALRRLFDAGYLSQEIFWQQYRQEEVRLDELDLRKGKGGGDYYRSLGVRTSKRFTRAVLESTLEGQTLFQEAFRLLGMRKPALC